MVKSRVQRNIVTHEHIFEDTDKLFRNLYSTFNIDKYNFRGFINHVVYVTSRITIYDRVSC